MTSKIVPVDPIIRNQLKSMPEKMNLPSSSSNLRFYANYYGLKEHPKDLKKDTPEEFVFYNLQLCYSAQKKIFLGKVGDMIVGFRIAGVPVKVTYDGIKNLIAMGLARLQDSNGWIVVGEPKEDLYFSWTEKFRELLLEQPEKDTIIESSKYKEPVLRADKL